jgi:general secretion pathway protein L
MRSLAPSLFARAAGQSDALIIAIGNADPNEPLSGTVLRRQAGHETIIRTLDLTSNTLDADELALTTCLRLPPGAVLSREVVLPMEAARDLHAVLGFEMDRLSPFAAGEVYWGVSNLKHDRARGKLNLTLSIVLRAQIDALRTALARVGLAPAFIEAGAGTIALQHGTPPRQTLQTALSCLCIFLAFACFGTPFLRQQIALDAAAQTIAAATPAADTAQALRQQLEAAASGRAAIAQARQAGDALHILATLTSALPDGTWLSDLTLKSGDLSFDGQSDNAARLIGILSAAPNLRDPSFTAPVTRSADGTTDMFSLHATAGQ